MIEDGLASYQRRTNHIGAFRTLYRGFNTCGRTARPGVLEPMERWVAKSHVRQLQLGPLSRRSSEELVRQTTPDVSKDVLRSLVARAEGNPLFLRAGAREGWFG